MAFGHHPYITTDIPLTLVSIMDPAVSEKTSMDDLMQYQRTGDESHLTITGEPTRFHCKAPTPSQLEVIIATGLKATTGIEQAYRSGS